MLFHILICTLGPAFKNVRGQLYPTVGLNWPGARVRARFGLPPPNLNGVDSEHTTIPTPESVFKRFRRHLFHQKTSTQVNSDSRVAIKHPSGNKHKRFFFKRDDNA